MLEAKQVKQKGNNLLSWISKTLTALLRHNICIWTYKCTLYIHTYISPNHLLPAISIITVGWMKELLRFYIFYKLIFFSIFSLFDVLRLLKLEYNLWYIKFFLILIPKEINKIRISAYNNIANVEIDKILFFIKNVNYLDIKVLFCLSSIQPFLLSFFLQE